MRTKRIFFGEYLVQKNVISEEMIYKALEIQKENTPTFTQAALSLGYLSVKQAFQLSTLQKDSDVSFRELCLHQKILSQAHVTAVETYIREHTPFLGEILKTEQFLDAKIVEKELEAFNRQKDIFLQIVKNLKNMALFKSLSCDDLESLSYIACIETYKAGEIVIREGEEADGLYCVLKGNLQVSKKQASCKEVYFATIETYDIFGETSIVEKKKRTATVKSLSDCTLLKFNREDFQAFLTTHLAASRTVLLYVIQRLLQKLDDASR